MPPALSPLPRQTTGRPRSLSSIQPKRRNVPSKMSRFVPCFSRNGTFIENLAWDISDRDRSLDPTLKFRRLPPRKRPIGAASSRPQRELAATSHMSHFEAAQVRPHAGTRPSKPPKSAFAAAIAHWQVLAERLTNSCCNNLPYACDRTSHETLPQHCQRNPRPPRIGVLGSRFAAIPRAGLSRFAARKRILLESWRYGLTADDADGRG